MERFPRVPPQTFQGKGTFGSFSAAALQAAFPPRDSTVTYAVPTSIVSNEPKPGTCAAQRHRARTELAELVQSERQEAGSDLGALYCCALYGCESALRIAVASRASNTISAGEFVVHQSMLAECIAQLDVLHPRIGELILHWPKTPGCTFAIYAGDSALELAWQFAHAIHTGAVCAIVVEMNMFASHLDDVHLSDPRFGDWRDATMKELRGLTLPLSCLSASVAELRCAGESLLRKLTAEYEIAIQQTLSTSTRLAKAASSESPRVILSTDARNAWLHEQCSKIVRGQLLEYPEIHRRLMVKCEKLAWEPISENAIKKTANRWAKRNGKPLVPDRKPGRKST